jgi:hypothetical protein
VAHGRFLVAEAKFERFARLRSPTGLNFDEKRSKSKKMSERAFLTYVGDSQRIAAEAIAAYEEVLTLPDGASTRAWRIASAARLARIPWLFASQLYGMEIPVDVRSGS